MLGIPEPWPCLLWVEKVCCWMHLVLTVTKLDLIAFLRASPLLSAVCCWSWLLSLLMFPLSPAQPIHLCIYLTARRAEQCSPVPLRWVQLRSPSGHSCSSRTVSPWLEAWFWRGGEKTEVIFAVENKTCAPPAAK